MSTRHIATTITAAQNLFSPESVEQIIREAGTLAAGVPEFAVNGNRALQAVADGVDTVDSMLEYLQDGFGATARNDGLFEPDEIAEAVEALAEVQRRLENGRESGFVFDCNGNRVGEWSFP